MFFPITLLIFMTIDYFLWTPDKFLKHRLEAMKNYPVSRISSYAEQ